jgi:hypothetical protein
VVSASRQSLRRRVPYGDGLAVWAITVAASLAAFFRARHVEHVADN